VTAALGQPNGRLENVEPSMRRVLLKVVGPLRLGTMHTAHFVVDLQHWLDLVERRRAETSTTTLTVRVVRSWLDGAETPAERRGLTTDVADLVILAVAAATDRSFVDAGRPVAKPEVGRLGADWELRSEELPSDELWQEALTRASHVGIVAASTLRSAASVADLNERIHNGLVGANADDVRELPGMLTRLTGVVELPDDCPRRRTAEAAAVLVQRLHASPDRAVSVLAQLEVPTTMAAIGTSIKQAAAVRSAVQTYNVELVGQAVVIGGEYEAQASSIRDRLAEAAVADESTIGLVSRLRDAETAATKLLTDVARNRVQETAATTTTPPPPPPPPGDSVSVRAQAEQSLDDVAQRLRQVGLRLEWTISETPDASS